MAAGVLEHLDHAIEIGSRRVRVEFENPPGFTRVVDILMTRDEWDDVVTVTWGSFDNAAEQVRERILGLQPNQRFLVYGQHELIASVSVSLPLDPDFEQLQDLARLHPEGVGTWVVLDEDGNVLDEFRAQSE